MQFKGIFMKGLFFERTIALFLGEKRSQNIAAAANSTKERKNFLKKIIKQEKRRIDKIDTSEEHKKQIMTAWNHIEEAIKSKEKVDWHLVDCLLRLIASLSGYSLGNHSNSMFYTPSYWQTKDQYLSQQRIKDNEKFSLKNEEQNAIEKREGLIKKLKNEGISTFDISLIFNTPEYKVKKITKK